MTWKGIVGASFTTDAFDVYARNVVFTAWRPQFVVLHNTSAPRLDQWHKVPGAQRMRNLESYYRDQQHWSAGPHLFVADDLIWVFTPLTTAGVRSPSWNAISWGVEMVGEYDDEAFGGAVRQNTIAALASLHEVAGVDPAMLHFHKEDPLTTHKDCPGKHVLKPDILAGVQSELIHRHGGEHTPDRPDLG